MKKIYLAMLAAPLLLASCGGGGSDSGTSGGGGNNNSQQTVSIDAMTSVPVMNGSSTKGTLYIHNDSDTAASNLKFTVNAGNTVVGKAKSSTLGSKFKLQGSLAGSNNVVLENPGACSSIAAHSYCAVNFTTPSLVAGDKGSSLVQLSYKQGSTVKNTMQVINYYYVDPNAVTGVNFSGSLRVTGEQTTTQHIVGYLYAGGNGQNYNKVNLNSNKATVQISNGFVNGQQVVSGQVIPVEFAVSMQGNSSSTAIVTPEWDAGSSQVNRKKLQSNSNVLVGAVLALAIAPAQNTVNLIAGIVPVLSTSSTAPVYIDITNNGNGDLSGGVAVTSDSSALQITNNCSTTTLSADAANSCQVGFAVESSGSGSATVKFSGGGAEITQAVNWLNPDIPEPAISVVSNLDTTKRFNLELGGATPDNSVKFTVSNSGGAPLESASYTFINNGPISWTQDDTTCGSSIAPAGQCIVSGHLTGSAIGEGTFYFQVAGNNKGKEYNSGSSPQNYVVTGAPDLVIKPIGINLTLLANGVAVESQVFTVTNQGNIAASLSGDAVLAKISSTTVKPSISQSTCTAGISIAPQKSCTVTVVYGPTASAANESGVATLQVDYSGGSQGGNYSSENSFNYNLMGNDASVSISNSAQNMVSGNGVESDPYHAQAKYDGTITLTYTNNSANYALTNFNVNANGLPLGLAVDSSGTTCSYGASTGTLGIGGACDLVLRIDRSVLASSYGTSGAILNFKYPTASWTTPLGFYSQASNAQNADVYLDYTQPSFGVTLSNNNGSFESTTLGITLANGNSAAGNTVIFNVSGVASVLDSTPLGNGCAINSSDFSANCSFTVNPPTSMSASITYLMPGYLQGGESVNIPLQFSTDTYAGISPQYMFINYVQVPMLVFFAGNGVMGYPTSGLAINSNFDNPSAVAVDSKNNTYIVDADNAVVVKVDSLGVLSIFAGIPGVYNCGSLPTESITASTQNLCHPTGVAVDSLDNVYIVDEEACMVYKVDESGILSYFAGSTLGAPNNCGNNISRGQANGAQLNQPSNMAFGPDGSAYIANSSAGTILKVSESGSISVFAGQQGNVGAPTFNINAMDSLLMYPNDVAVDTNGVVYIADTYNYYIESVGADGIIRAFAGIGQPGRAVEGNALNSPLNNPTAIVTDRLGNVYIADSENYRVERVDSAGMLTFFAGNGIKADSATPIVSGVALATPLYPAFGLEADLYGNVLISDGWNHQVLKVYQ